ncbi:hypothetical protein [Pseudomonas sp. NFACC13-1]|uniref:hypothetical protein n=1 Tax=Pseudomonas sp. NFACC13-1 TaxID=1566245 RepID=UPI000B87CBDB|nr:hypothetical protein [Pseudomonas sp. NFACC13-1]
MYSHDLVLFDSRYTGEISLSLIPKFGLFALAIYHLLRGRLSERVALRNQISVPIRDYVNRKKLDIKLYAFNGGAIQSWGVETVAVSRAQRLLKIAELVLFTLSKKLDIAAYEFY